MKLDNLWPGISCTLSRRNLEHKGTRSNKLNNYTHRESLGIFYQNQKEDKINLCIVDTNRLMGVLFPVVQNKHLVSFELNTCSI